MKKYTVDIIVIALIILFSLLMFFIFSSKMNEDGDADEVIILVDGSIYGTYPLNEENVIKIDTKYGHNTLNIMNNSVWMSDSDCDNLSCVNMGKISHSYESIICIPHRVVIELRSKNKENIDAIAY